MWNCWPSATFPAAAPAGEETEDADKAREPYLHGSLSSSRLLMERPVPRRARSQNRCHSLPLRGVLPGQSAVFRGLRLVTGAPGDFVEVARISMVTPAGFAGASAVELRGIIRVA